MNTTGRLLLAVPLILVGLGVWVILVDGHPQDLGIYQMTTELMTRWVGLIAAAVGLFRLATLSSPSQQPAEAVIAGALLLAGVTFAQPNWATALGLAAVLVALMVVPRLAAAARSDDPREG
jgi:peptidoglycan/LPS O-acetylase OafA/YrhL